MWWQIAGASGHDGLVTVWSNGVNNAPVVMRLGTNVAEDTVLALAGGV